MGTRKFAALVVLSFVLSGTTQAQPESFLLSSDTLSRSYISTYIGNGNIGVSSSQNGVDSTPSYMAWVFDHAPRDVARIAALPAWNALDVFNGKKWLGSVPQNTRTLQKYRQSLNMHDGVLETSYLWNDGGRVTRVAVTLLVSRANPHLAAVRLALEPRFSGQMQVSFPIRQWPEPQRMPLAEDAHAQNHITNGHPDVWYPGHMTATAQGAKAEPRANLAWVVAKPDGAPSAVAVVEQAVWTGDTGKFSVTSDTASSGPTLTVSFTAKAGKSYSFDKIVAIVSSRDSLNPLASAHIVASAAARRGFDVIRHESAQAWHDLWKTDVVVKGDSGLQKAIHSSMFYLLCSARGGTDFALPPMGLSSDGYYGHIFWDSDTWMFPPLLLTHPAIARSLVMFRYHALPAAQANAKANGRGGAMYPWESDEVGNESTPRFAYQNALMENHVTGDVAYAQWQYFLATSDTPWLAKFGRPVIEATADFWARRARYDSSAGHYSIDSVVSVDEGLIGVSNDTYTNAVARRNLEIATRVSAITGQQPNPLWNQVAAKLVILVDSTRKVHRAYQNAPDSVISGVAPLIVYPLAYTPPQSVVINDLRNALNITEKEGGGAMMTTMLYPVVAAELQDRELFDDFLKVSYRQWMRGPFHVFSETPKNMSTNFLTGAGAFLQQVLFGYTGLRISEEGLRAVYPPMLPKGVTGMIITNVPFRGKMYDVSVNDGKTKIVKK